MKLKEQLALEFSERREHDAYSHGSFDGFIAGFEAAIRLAEIRGRIAQLEKQVVDVEIRKLGEE